MVNQDNDFERSLNDLREMRVPELPGDIQARVWRSIRRNEETASSSVVFGLPLVYAQPAFAMTFLLVTTIFGFFYESAYAESNRKISEAEVLGIENVFSANSPYLPSSLLFPGDQ